MDVDSFISTYKEKYKTITFFQNLLNNISEETYPTIIQYVEDHKKIFLKDRETAILFLSIIEDFSLYNFKQFQLILDVFIHFINEVKQVGIDELDIIDFSKEMPYMLSYLYNKKILNIDSIYRESIYNLSIFIYFYPEIDEYDHEYASKKKNDIIDNAEQGLYEEKILIFMNHVVKNIKEHIKNRSLCLDPSPLYKSIREDDIESFQSILSKNNYNVNHKFDISYYDIALTEDINPSLIQIAAIYGSLNIFKFLWMQPKIEINENLIDYAVSGRNFEIIHICETKCPLRRALIFAIASHQNELSEYIIENTEKQENENEDDENDDNIYNNLKYSELKYALEFLNYDVIIPCLKNIVSIIHKYDNYDELEREDKFGQNSVFSVRFYDIELFKFLFDNRNPNFSFFDGMNPVCFLWLMNRTYDIVKYLIQFFNPEQLYQIFEDSVRVSPKVACLIMDLQIDEIKNENHHHPVFDFFKHQIDDMENYFYIYASDYFDVDVMTKALNLYYVIIDAKEFFYLIQSLSKKMRNSLLKNKMPFQSKKIVIETANFFKDCGMHESAELILKYN